MSRIYIDNPIESGFTRVPNGLWALEMSLKAKGLFAFLLSFHHGAAPSVGEIETALGLGKDARQAAFRELVQQRLAGWRVVRNAAGRAVSKEMWISARPLLLQALQAALSQEPGFPALGETVQEPGFPAAGFSGSMSRENRQHEPENPAISLNKTKKNKTALPAVRLAARAPMPVALSPFQRSRVASGQSLLVGNVTVLPGSLQMLELTEALRSQTAENEGRLS